MDCFQRAERLSSREHSRSGRARDGLRKREVGRETHTRRRWAECSRRCLAEQLYTMRLRQLVRDERDTFSMFCKAVDEELSTTHSQSTGARHIRLVPRMKRLLRLRAVLCVQRMGHDRPGLPRYWDEVAERQMLLRFGAADAEHAEHGQERTNDRLKIERTGLSKTTWNARRCREKGPTKLDGME